ncbi:MAG TPA: phage Gp37/Gp68 family protein [Anaeromyxobacteraceae bacterium]|nr:phage Gp37/Gp68 family protein [Anaeromyxobacteraceae bacterium]
MADNTSIEWTESTWNPVTGCTKVSAGCANCYAERMARRLQAMGQPNYRNGFQVTMHDHTLELPLKWAQPRRIFVNSMSDLFHEDVPDGFIVKVFDVMRRAHWHTFQVLTKRSGRLATLGPTLHWPSNVWAGVSVENDAVRDRVDDLRCLKGPIVRFLSVEPLLGPLVGLDLAGIDWVIVGGESGPGARAMEIDWVRSIRGACQAASVPFFFKQWGGTNRKVTGRVLDGRVWSESPDDGEAFFVEPAC